MATTLQQTLLQTLLQTQTLSSVTARVATIKSGVRGKQLSGNNESGCQMLNKLDKIYRKYDIPETE